MLPIIVALLINAVWELNLAYNEAQETYDSELYHVTNLTLSILLAEDKEESLHNVATPQKDDDEITHDIIELGSDFEDSNVSHKRDLAFRIWKGDKLLFCSRKASNFGELRVKNGYSNQKIDGSEWRFFVLNDPKTHYTIEVAQKFEIRDKLILKTRRAVFIPLLFLFPVILFMVMWGLRNSLKPLHLISEAVTKRSANDLTPLPNYLSIDEISPVVSSINDLFARLEYVLTKERRFTDFAAHELRTPIAIFKTQAQTALSSKDDNERREILEAQVQAADRATKMVDQLLILARLEHIAIPKEDILINQIIQSLIEDRFPLIQQKKIDLSLAPEFEGTIFGNLGVVSIMVANLLDNAIKYTPTNGKINIRIYEEDSRPCFSITDNGHGIPEEEIFLVTERFYRSREHQHHIGSGLGLSIVSRACEVMKAKLIIRNNEKPKSGIEVLVIFGNGKNDKE